MRPALPTKRSLTLAYLVSLLIAQLMTIASVVGLLYQTHLYPEKQLLSFASTDGSNLMLALPILLGSLWLARRGKLIGLLCWPGALFYIVYTYAFYVVGVPFGALFLPYLILVTASGYTIIGLVASIDGEAVRQRLTSGVPARIAGGLLVGIASLLIAWEGFAGITALVSQASIDPQTYNTWVVDLAVACPALLVGGILLWRRQALGYVVGAGLLLQIGVLFVSVPVLLGLQALFAAAPLDVMTVVLLLIVGALPLILLAFFARGAARGQRAAADSTKGTALRSAEPSSERRTDESGRDELLSASPRTGFVGGEERSQ